MITFKRRYHYPHFEEEDSDSHRRQTAPSDSLCYKEVEKPKLKPVIYDSSFSALSNAP